MSSAVRVERLPFGSTSFSQCRAELIAEDTLAVICTDEAWTATHGPMQVYQPEHWIEATVYDVHGNKIQKLTSKTGLAIDQHRRQRVHQGVA